MSEETVNLIYCESCGSYIGHYIEHENRVWLKIGNAVLYSAHGACGRCGMEYHFWSSEKHLEKLIYRLTGKSLSAKIQAG
jgi:hypothetical protein